ncbi:excinuclease ABC subunit UvrA, partial [Candidatus Woesebacteria bacterium]|nr:excinuclease ABC subunit UvrA [Candidatus Woesebacteria bacterium]
MENVIKIRGAKQHNLKNINLDIPKGKLVVFTGVSGSGKSSLAFDTIYAEGQRRYVESLSTYARQFLGVMEKPDVDHIDGLSPAISIDQKTTSKNPRSTVGTVTEIYDYLRLLFARIGHPHCPICGREITHMSIDQIVSSAMQLILDETKVTRLGRFLVLSPLVIDRKGEFSGLFDNLKAKGFKQVRVDGVIKDLAEDFLLLKTNKHTIETVIDRLSLSQANTKDKLFLNNLKSRLTDSASQALNLSEGTIKIAKITDEGFDLPQYPKKFEDHLFSEKFACPVDNITLEEIEPRTFSFNSPHGACPTCSGLGKILKVEPDLVFSEELSIMEGGILPFSNMFEHDTWFSRVFLKVCEEAGINPRKPIKSLGKKEKDIILYGTGDRQYKVAGNNRFGHLTHIRESFPGLTRELEKKHAETESDFVRWEIEKYMRQKVCQTCNGARLKKEALSITIGGLSISEVTSFSVIKSGDWIATLLEKTVENEREKEIARLIVKEIGTRLNFLKSVGLEYLTLDREAGSLSGGEAQRIRLASQIGSGLTGVLYVLDEPTIGLHQRDNQKLIDTLKKLRDLGNTVIVVEHDA